jgi:hypothetical protein
MKLESESNSNEDPMEMVTNMARKVIRDKFTAEVETAAAKLQTLKAEAKTAKADFEIKAITELLAKQREILHKMRDSEK